MKNSTEILNDEAENENTLFSLAILRRIPNEDLIRSFIERKKELKLEQEENWHTA